MPAAFSFSVKLLKSLLFFFFTCFALLFWFILSSWLSASILFLSFVIFPPSLSHYLTQSLTLRLTFSYPPPPPPSPETHLEPCSNNCSHLGRTCYGGKSVFPAVFGLLRKNVNIYLSIYLPTCFFGLCIFLSLLIFSRSKSDFQAPAPLGDKWMTCFIRSFSSNTINFTAFHASANKVPLFSRRNKHTKQTKVHQNKTLIIEIKVIGALKQIRSVKKWHCLPSMSCLNLGTGRCGCQAD